MNEHDNDISEMVEKLRVAGRVPTEKQRLEIALHMAYGIMKSASGYHDDARAAYALGAMGGLLIAMATLYSDDEVFDMIEKLVSEVRP